ncbi:MULTISPECIES: indole-3-glycerol-phosphate synthase [unclassified Pseudodesulfovibrio]|uniref:indole-3-glycerol phosphate synthase TrpC n=1 Tax=unclassified Pseudodesulfovibrio TaxID=2661612 RepID=UPI000FEB6EC7|nr:MULTISPECIES: indole-3-glycerol-phosphate synthase [unclassified Pseudodesulfovibrio]MCJ2164593.1 indole-3-glycerol-phosphate synthase [Pseudodesulfovibrio sp. S3-i]RWU04212.1 indole-3-glycerol-phosphate synthase [Pseudodesulfovibrio sp. S3]
MLDKFREAKQLEIDSLRKDFIDGRIPALYRGERPSFVDAVKAKGPGAVIAEFKPASPSKGILRESLNPLDFADMYAANGAAAISVLTEHKYFHGTPDFLFMMSQPGVPLLRKDFIFDPLQVAMTASSPASAVLLIARMCDDATHLQQLIEISRMSGLAPVVEIFDQDDLDLARKAGADIIQVNNRDLDTLEISLDQGRRFVKQKQDQELWICASGVSQRSQVEEMAGLGFDAVLIGTCLMEAEDPGAKLAELTGAM